MCQPEKNKDNNQFWYHKKQIPEFQKKSIQSVVKGEKIMRLPAEDMHIYLLKVNSSVFSKVFSLNRPYLFRGEFTAPVEENDYQNAECFLTEDGLAGFAITNDRWLISLFSNESWHGFMDSTKEIVMKKADKLVCIVTGSYKDSPLIKAYEKTCGFMPLARTLCDEQIMREYYGDSFIDDFIHYNGEPYHVFMHRLHSIQSGDSIQCFDNYIDAKEWMDRQN